MIGTIIPITAFWRNSVAAVWGEPRVEEVRTEAHSRPTGLTRTGQIWFRHEIQTFIR
jgi:hypothetical protein